MKGRTAWRAEGLGKVGRMQRASKEEEQERNQWRKRAKRKR